MRPENDTTAKPENIKDAALSSIDALNDQENILNSLDSTQKEQLLSLCKEAGVPNTLLPTDST